MQKTRKPRLPAAANKSTKDKIAAVLSAVLWSLSFFLAFIISSKSHYIWVPDLLLLSGFVPLLLMWKPAWPWLVFGCLNVLIGFVLEVNNWIPAAQLPVNMHAVHQHLMQFHVSMVWILVGFASILYAVFRLIKGVVRHLFFRRKPH